MPGLRLTAIVVGLIGFAMLGGGLWLIALDGSGYYAVAGFAMLATAVLLWRRRRSALLVYALVVLGTLAWAVAEIGLDWWQLVPRGDVVFLLGLMLLMPWVTRPLAHGPGQARAPWRGAAGPLVAALVVAAGVGIAALLQDPHDRPGRLPGARSALPKAYGGIPDDDWAAYGRSWRGNRWSPLTQLTPANVSKLQVAWTMRTGDRKRDGDPNEITYEVTPIKVGDTLYLCTPHNHVLALDAETGRVRWRFDPHIEVTGNMQHLTCRGVSYHAAVPGAVGDCLERIFTATNDARLIALDARTGRPCRSFGQGGQVNLRPAAYPLGWYQFTSPPLVTRGLAVVAGAIYDNASTTMPSGVIRAFDAMTGRLVWNFDPGNPTSTKPISAGERYVASTPNSWSSSAADEALGLIYVPMGNGAVDQWGGNRSPMTERYTSSILALDAATGRERWVFQTVHHDLWDMDVPAQPALVDIDLPGRGRVPALVQVTKTGNIFVLDRRTGVPVHAVTEHRVPGGPAPGDRLSPTQPFSRVSLMPERPLREADMWGATPFDQLFCRIRFRQLRYEGPFTPPSIRGTLVYPGNFGIIDWGGVAIDPVRQIAFANPDYMAFVDRLVPRPRAGQVGPGPTGGSDLEGGSQEHGLNPNAGAPFAVYLNPFLSPLGLPCQAPPWGYVAGVDLVSGDTVWRHPNGTIRDQSPVPLPFRMGVPSLGGPIATAGGIAFLTSTLDYYVRGYDVATGEQLWQARLPAGAQATPMTYRSAVSGRQFLVVVAGGHGSLGTKMGDHVIAYALPRRAG